MTNTLPDTLSALIRVALVDLRKCEEDDKYSINMYTWHSPLYEDGTCAVCLAGSVMAKTLETEINDYSDPHGTRYGLDTNNKLYALNNALTGYVGLALDVMGVPFTDKYNRRIKDYEYDSTLYHKQMSQLADDLEADGL